MDVGLTQNLVVVVTVDHGEQLGEHSYAGGHAGIYREIIRVPLIIKGPEIGKGIVELNLSLMDISVSLLFLLSLRFSGPFDGRSFFKKIGKFSFQVRTDKAESWSLLILRNPAYTQSIGLVKDRFWYIINLDYFYQFAGYESLSISTGLSQKEEFWEAKFAKSDEAGKVSIFPFPPARKLRPYYVTGEVRLKDDESPAKISVFLLPSLSYFREPIPFQVTIRIYYPVSKEDTKIVRIRPAHYSIRSYITSQTMKNLEKTGILYVLSNE